MRTSSLWALFIFVFASVSSFVGLWDAFERGSQHSPQSVKVNQQLLQENKLLKVNNSRLRNDLLKVQAQAEHSLLKRQGRAIASTLNPDDVVQFEVYQWSEEKLWDLAEQSFFFKHYKKAVQYYNALAKHYPSSGLLNDEFHFHSGLASLETGTDYYSAIENFETIEKKFPDSKYFRGAKLWLALAYYKAGKEGRFLASVNEFREKYRNTKEWRVLSKYYEDIAYKYKK